jgi:hypothetical protein
LDKRIQYTIEVSTTIDEAAEQMVIIAQHNMCPVDATFNGIPISCGYQCTPEQIVRAWYEEHCRRTRARAECEEANELYLIVEKLRDNAEKQVALPVHCF